jgi:hypothetical protein
MFWLIKLQTTQNNILIVKLQVPASSIWLIANRTMVTFLSPMTPHVFIQFWFTDEAFTTSLTQMWSLTCIQIALICSHMHNNFSLQRLSRRTMHTCMYPRMVFQFLLLPKLLATIIAGKFACFCVSIEVCH